MHSRRLPTVCATVITIVLTVPAVVVQVVAAGEVNAVAPTRMCHGQPATIVGSNHEDEISGTTGADVVWLGAGSDDYENPGGRDTVCGGRGNDVLSVPASGQRVYGGRGQQDQLFFTDESFDNGLKINARTGKTTSPSIRLTRHTGVEIFNGTPKNDVFIGNSANNDYSGEDGFDRVRLGGGNDFAQIYTGVVRGGSGRDRITAQWAPLPRRALTKIWGGGGDDYLTGSDRRDVIQANGGDDFIEGANGSDTLDGGAGTDSVKGGSGTDRCGGEQRQSCERFLN